jgi:tRNA dimethylallyltransferase
MSPSYQWNLLVVLGPTASGKTRLGVELAKRINGEIISADSRQVFRHMDLGTGKDLHEYGPVPYHLIDILEPGEDFSLFAFVKHFSKAFLDISARGRLPVLVGGTGLYLDAILRGYQLNEVPEDPELRHCLAQQDLVALQARLLTVSASQHNTTDLLDRERLIRAIELAEASARSTLTIPPVRPLVLGIRWERSRLRQRITQRLHERLRAGLVEEVQQLRAQGVTDTTLEAYGLEYRFLARYLRGELSRNDMVQKLASAIHDFAKRQETWFRRMERNGVTICWVGGEENPLDAAWRLLNP